MKTITRNTHVVILAFILLLAAVVVAVGLSYASDDDKEQGETIRGNGTWTTVVEEAQISSFDPPNECISILTRSGAIEFTGIIQNEPENGHFDTAATIDSCIEGYVQAYSTATFTFNEVTIAGRTGGAEMKISLRCEVTGGVFTCQGTLEILSGTGRLKGVSGEGVFVATVPSEVTGAVSFYWIEVHFDNGDSDGDSDSSSS